MIKRNLFVMWLISLPFLVLLGQESSDSLELSDSLGLLEEQYSPENELPSDTFLQRQFDNKFKERYKGSDFDYTGDDKPKKKNDQPFNFHFSPVWGWIFKVLIFLLLIYGVYLIVSILMGKEGNWLMNKKSNLLGLEYQNDDDLSVTHQYEDLIKVALQNGDLRMAIRYHYLFVLQNLVAKGIIQYQKEKTNSDYRYEIKDKQLKDQFTYISYIYDHAWYGKLNIKPSDYQLANRAFTDIKNMI